MGNLKRFLVVSVLVSLVVVMGVLGLVQAQDTTAGSVQCDADLILNLYIAERFFGFNQVRDAMMTSGMDTSSMVDLNTLDWGQYRPWFDMNMANVSDGTRANVWTDDQVNAVSGMWMMDDSTFDSTMNAGTDTSSMTSLTPAAIADEPAECSQLRNELRRFFRIVSFQDLSGGFGTTGGTLPGAGSDDNANDNTSGGAEATPEATP